MLILVDKKIPEQALKSLEKRGEVVLFETKGITYDAISGHPDIFFCQSPCGLIVAPNTPDKYLNILKSKKIKFTFGNNNIECKYPFTSFYNALVTSQNIVHNRKYTDNKILELNKNKRFTNVNQSYSRCSCVYVNGLYLTSDMGIYKAITAEGFSAYYIRPDSIVLSGFKHGFWGGCCGVYNNQLFVSGNLNYLFREDKQKLCGNSNLDIVELYSGPLYDVGGILFIE